MNDPTMRFKRVIFAGDVDTDGRDEYLAEYGLDGLVLYEKTDQRGSTWEFVQAFKQGVFHRIPHGPLVWGWDGNREAPTLTPSFLMEGSSRIHLFFTKGRVDLLSDSTVKLESGSRSVE